jgi:hypothetical protein
MLSVTNKSFMLSVDMLNVNMLGVVMLRVTRKSFVLSVLGVDMPNAIMQSDVYVECLK